MQENINEKIEVAECELPAIEVVELVCQNTPDWTHGTKTTLAFQRVSELRLMRINLNTALSSCLLEY